MYKCTKSAELLDFPHSVFDTRRQDGRKNLLQITRLH